MKTNEDLWTENVNSNEDVQNTTTEVENTATETENNSEEVSDKTTEVENNQITLTDEDLDLILKDIDSIKEEEEEIQNKPKFVPKEIEESEYITEEEIEEIDKLIEDITKENEENEYKIWDLSTQIEDLTSKIEESNKEKELMEEAFSKASTHPVIWPYVIKLAKWEDIQIPELIENQLKKDVESMPNLENINEISVPTKVETLQDRLNRTSVWQWE